MRIADLRRAAHVSGGLRSRGAEPVPQESPARYQISAGVSFSIKKREGKKELTGEGLQPKARGAVFCYFESKVGAGVAPASETSRVRISAPLTRPSPAPPRGKNASVFGNCAGGFSCLRSRIRLSTAFAAAQQREGGSSASPASGHFTFLTSLSLSTT